jgi:hypothetical protein
MSDDFADDDLGDLRELEGELALVLAEKDVGTVGDKGAEGAAKHPGMITKAAKVALGVKAAQGVSKRPGVVRLGLKAGKPIARRTVRQLRAQRALIPPSPQAGGRTQGPVSIVMSHTGPRCQRYAATSSRRVCRAS